MDGEKMTLKEFVNQVGTRLCFMRYPDFAPVIVHTDEIESIKPLGSATNLHLKPRDGEETGVTVSVYGSVQDTETRIQNGLEPHSDGEAFEADVIAQKASEAVRPFKARGEFWDYGLHFRLKVIGQEMQTLLEWKNIPSAEVRDPSDLDHLLSELRRQLEEAGHELESPLA